METDRPSVNQLEVIRESPQDVSHIINTNALPLWMRRIRIAPQALQQLHHHSLAWPGAWATHRFNAVLTQLLAQGHCAVNLFTRQ